nr:plasmid replication protein RepC-8 [Sulfitobacter guttiformis]
MKHSHQTSFGRHISAVPIKPKSVVSDAMVESAEQWDKWHLLTALTQAAEEFGLTHRSIAVLRALLSFHPTRAIGITPHSAIVFPANNTLSQRLGGMPESTLRRHLATLVSTGIVSRRDSANRKRFARAASGGTRLAFGFDLSPLARLATDIMAASEAAQARRTHLQTLRAELAALRQEAIDHSGPDTMTDTAFKLLRRKPDEKTLKAAISDLQIRADTIKTSAADAQNERHIQPESKIYSKLEQQLDQCNTTQEPSFEAVVGSCTEYLSFFPEPVRNWHDLSRVAYALGPMMGIDRPTLEQASRQMGQRHAIVAVLCILENLERIGNPGGYLMRLVQQSREGQLDLATLLNQRTLLK